MKWDVCYQKFWNVSEHQPWPTSRYWSQNSHCLWRILNRTLSEYKSETLSLEAVCSVPVTFCLSRHFLLMCNLNVTKPSGQWAAFTRLLKHVNIYVCILSKILSTNFPANTEFHLTFPSFIHISDHHTSFFVSVSLTIFTRKDYDLGNSSLCNLYLFQDHYILWTYCCRYSLFPMPLYINV
jgi:hypothetical protein